MAKRQGKSLERLLEGSWPEPSARSSEYIATKYRISGQEDTPPCFDESLPEGWTVKEAQGHKYYVNIHNPKPQFNHPNNCNRDDSELPSGDAPKSPTMSFPSPIPEETQEELLEAGSLDQESERDLPSPIPEETEAGLLEQDNISKMEEIKPIF